MARGSLVFAVAALAGCQWIAGIDDALPRAAAPPGASGTVDAGRDAAVPTTPSNATFLEEALADRPIALYRFAGVVDGLCVDSAGGNANVQLASTCEYAYPRPAITTRTGDPTIGFALADPRQCWLPLPVALDFTNGDFTYEMWIRPSAPGALLVSRDLERNGPGVELQYQGNNISYARYGSTLLASAVAPITSLPRHVVITSADGQPTLYVDGVEGSGLAIKRETIGKTVLRIGEAEGDYGPVVVYDRALAKERVAAHWRAGSSQ